MRVAVVGAGIVGASVAYRLAEGGAEVVLVDRGVPGGGTTGASFAWANANEKTPREYFDLNYAGLREHYRLREEFGEAPWLHPGGNLVWSREAGESERRVERLREWGYAAEVVTARRVNAELEPGVEFQDPDTPVAFFPEEGWVDAPLLARWFAEGARNNGADVRAGCAVEGVRIGGVRVSGIRLQSGEEVPADAVVNAAGAGADGVAKMAGNPLPLAPARGLLVRLAVSGSPTRRLLHSPEVNLRPDGAGYMLLHHTSVDSRIDAEDRRSLAGELLDRARRIVPALQNARVAEVKVGTRPIPADGYPSVGPVRETPGYYEAVTHSGVTLGPLMGRLLAQEILAGEEGRLLSPYRPERLREASTGPETRHTSRRDPG